MRSFRELLNWNGAMTRLGAMILVLLAASPSLADKQDARDVGCGISVIGAAGVITPEPLTTAAGAGAMLGQGVGFIGMGIWDFFAAAPANPDPNHGVVANEELLFVQVAFVRLEGVGPVYDEVNASMSSAASMIDSSRFALTSLQRYYGAIADSNAANAELQRQAANAALAQLDVDMLQYRSDLRAISNAVQGTDFAALSATVQDVLDLRDEIVANQSFPSEEDFVFNQMNASPEEMALAIAEVELMTGNSLTNGDLTGAVIFDRLDEALGKVNIQELLPAEFGSGGPTTSVPLIGETGMAILLGCLVLSGLFLTRMRRASRTR